MIRPKPLSKGDKIGLIGPCSPPAQERIEASISAMENLGLKVVLGNSVNKSYGFLCGTDEERAADINDMFANKEIKGIFAIRGGYGSGRILNKINYKNIKKNPKIFAGYSDVTALHIAINQKCKLITYHTPMASTEFYKGVDDYTIKSFEKLIFDEKPVGNITNPENCEKFKALSPGVAEGVLTGGNLSLVVSSIGTPYEINTKNKILFLEEIDEPPYKIDRMFLQLKMNGKFKDAKAIVLGAFTNCKAADERRSLSMGKIIEDMILSEGKPTICNIKCGHCLPTMSLALGSKFIVDCYNEKIIEVGD